ncbi:MAG: class D beta-lactamase [Sandaracinaceae bacterium]|nr:class D beta-lactamase [Sandaracinaceae bacterium]
MSRAGVFSCASLCWMLVALSGCGASVTPTSATSASSNFADSRGSITSDPALAVLLSDAAFEGVIALHNDSTSTIQCSDEAACVVRERPASTFKIANAIIALETGVAPSAELMIPWDGVTRQVEAWNHDHTLRSAMAASAVPYYQEIARRIGLTRMQAGVNSLTYGNRQIGTVVDRFWLDGPLAISPLEQIQFLERLATGALPISERTQSIVKDILTLDQTDGVLRGKTGWADPDSDHEIGWFVGWLERDSARTYVAVLLRRGNHAEDEFRNARRQIAERALRAQ